MRPALPTTLDHFQCYPVKPLSATKLRRVGVRDEFGSGKQAVGRPVRLCNPASKNGSRIRDPRDHLLCYPVDPLQASTPHDVVVANQFEGSSLAAITAKLLCLPSLKRRVPPTRPDLTPKIDQASLTVNCTAGAGTCVTKFSFTVTNAGGSASGPFDVLAKADPGQSKTLSVAGGLAAGASTTLTASFRPAGNCFDPDCTVSVTADSGNVVTEDLVFMFVSMGGQPHSMTRRSLDRLVVSRLLRTVDSGAVVQHALEAMVVPQPEALAA